MFSHLTNSQLSIIGLVIAIFVIKPIPLFEDRHSSPNSDIFSTSQFHQNTDANRFQIREDRQ